MDTINVPRNISFINVVCHVINILPVANYKSKTCQYVYWFTGYFSVAVSFITA